MAIAESEWVWQGHAGHFIGADECRFHMATRIGDFLISTVGDYYPPPARERRTIGAGKEAFYETYVFKAGEQLACGCTDIDPSELEGIRYGDAADAQRGHMEMCRQYAERQEEGRT